MISSWVGNIECASVGLIVYTSVWLIECASAWKLIECAWEERIECAWEGWIEIWVCFRRSFHRNNRVCPRGFRQRKTCSMNWMFHIGSCRRTSSGRRPKQLALQIPTVRRTACAWEEWIEYISVISPSVFPLENRVCSHGIHRPVNRSSRAKGRWCEGVSCRPSIQSIWSYKW